MNCKELRELMPNYINHTATESEIMDIEEHLCICNSCRQFLSNYMDKKEVFSSQKTEKAKFGYKQRDKSPIGLLEYLTLAIGILVLGFLLYLLFKG